MTVILGKFKFYRVLIHKFWKEQAYKKICWNTFVTFVDYIAESMQTCF